MEEYIQGIRKGELVHQMRANISIEWLLKAIHPLPSSCKSSSKTPQSSSTVQDMRLDAKLGVPCRQKLCDWLNPGLVESPDLVTSVECPVKQICELGPLRDDLPANGESHAAWQRHLEAPMPARE